MTLNVILDGEPLQAQVEIRYLPAPDQWFFSLRDHATGELLVNMIPLICSRGEVNDLLLPFRHLRGGKGIGTLICLKAGEETAKPDPSAGNLKELNLIWTDCLREEGGGNKAERYRNTGASTCHLERSGAESKDLPARRR